MDDSEHQKWIGASNKPVLANLERVIASGIPTVIRFPLIPGVNDSPENLLALGEKAAELNQRAPTRIEIMPYHNYGANKYDMLHRSYELSAVTRPSEKTLAAAKQTLENCGVECLVR